MSKRAAKLTLISTGIVSGLLLILYLPVLIWSPPWSINGIYKRPSDLGLVAGTQGICTTYFALHETNKLAPIYAFENDFKLPDLEYLVTNDHRWSLTGTFMLIDGQLHSRNNIIGSKTTNPFTLWHIKWLEWTN